MFELTGGNERRPQRLWTEDKPHVFCTGRREGKLEFPLGRGEGRRHAGRGSGSNSCNGDLLICMSWAGHLAIAQLHLHADHMIQPSGRGRFHDAGFTYMHVNQHLSHRLQQIMLLIT
jgi:hypothetical protein